MAGRQENIGSTGVFKSVNSEWLRSPVPRDFRQKIRHSDIGKPRVSGITKLFRNKLFRNLALAGTVVAIAGTGIGYMINRNNENQQRIETSSSFDPSATDTSINPNNSVQMTLDEYEKLGVQLWDPENKTLTIPLPIIFKDNRTPTLHVKKGNDTQIRSSTLPSFYLIDDGLQEGDIICSPFDGEIRTGFYEIETSGYLRDFTLIPGDGSAKQGTYLIRTIPPSRPLFDTKDAIRLGENVDNFSIRVKKGDPILEILATIDNKTYNPQFSMLGNSSVEGDEVLNLATSGKDVILLKK